MWKRCREVCWVEVRGNMGRGVWGEVYGSCMEVLVEVWVSVLVCEKEVGKIRGEMWGKIRGEIWGVWGGGCG